MAVGGVRWPVGKCWYCQRKLLNLDYSSGSMDNCPKLNGGEGAPLVRQAGFEGRVELGE